MARASIVARHTSRARGHGVAKRCAAARAHTHASRPTSRRRCPAGSRRANVACAASYKSGWGASVGAARCTDADGGEWPRRAAASRRRWTRPKLEHGRSKGSARRRAERRAGVHRSAVRPRTSDGCRQPAARVGAESQGMDSALTPRSPRHCARSCLRTRPSRAGGERSEAHSRGGTRPGGGRGCFSCAAPAAAPVLRRAGAGAAALGRERVRRGHAVPQQRRERGGGGVLH